MALWAAWNPLQAAALYPVPEGPEMYRCIVCHFDVELDDVELRGGARSCVCVRCYARQVDAEHPMPKELRRDLIQTLAGVSY